jgi:hypothetical protein
MNKEFFNNLVNAARSESPPQTDVADSVINILAASAKQPVSVYDKTMMWFAAVSSAAAVAVSAVTAVIYQLTANPMMEISEAIAWIL